MHKCAWIAITRKSFQEGLTIPCKTKGSFQSLSLYLVTIKCCNSKVDRCWMFKSCMDTICAFSFSFSVLTENNFSYATVLAKKRSWKKDCFWGQRRCEVSKKEKINALNAFVLETVWGCCFRLWLHAIIIWGSFVRQKLQIDFVFL